MDCPKFIVSNQKEESISIQRVTIHRERSGHLLEPEALCKVYVCFFLILLLCCENVVFYCVFLFLVFTVNHSRDEATNITCNYCIGFGSLKSYMN